MNEPIKKSEKLNQESTSQSGNQPTGHRSWNQLTTRKLTNRSENQWRNQPMRKSTTDPIQPGNQPHVKML
uniref:Uncharacterized protein n=1 Tax=Romanomermis culicivorax TaxID=13658 RepID=A0A915ISY6_ROMCU